IHWDRVWGRSNINPPGKVAVGFPENDQLHDEILMQLWVGEGLPYPQIEGEWNREVAETWLADWQSRFEDQSTMIVQASSERELYTMADLGSRLGMNGIYLHTDTWRGEYWPRHNSFLNVRRDIFPDGEDSLKKFADYLRERDMGIAVHFVSGSIAPEDPDYLKNGIDDRLATWVSGNLVEPFDGNSKTILLRTEEGFAFPDLAPEQSTLPEAIPTWFDVNCFQIGENLVVARHRTIREDGIWELSQLSTDLAEQELTSWPAGTAVRGLLRPYGQVFTADVDSSLLQEVTSRYAAFCNRNNITHLECDGLEIHRSRPWGADRFGWQLYSKMDHPCTSNTSNGRPLRFHIEYWFKSSEAVIRNRPQGGVAGGDGIPLLLHKADRCASGPYEIHFKPTVAALNGRNSVNLIRPIAMFGISSEMIQNHGLSEATLQAVTDWKRILPHVEIPAETVDHFDLQRLEIEGRVFGAHKSTTMLLRPITTEGADAIQPFTAMRSASSFNRWGWGQEYGPLVPRTYIQTNQDQETLTNPFEDQPPEVLLRILPSFEDADAPLTTSEIADSSGGTLEPDSGASIVEQYEIGASGFDSNTSPDAGPDTEPEAQATPYIDLMPARANQIRNAGGQTAELIDGSIILSATNTDDAAKTNFEDRPRWPVNLNLENSRGLKLRIRGDNSGATLVITLDGRSERDYVLPINFADVREFVIPCGEVAWCDKNWGWSPDNRSFDYSQVRRVEAGFSRIPANSAPAIEIESFAAVVEKPVQVSDLTVKLGGGALTFQGVVRTGNYLWYRGGNRADVYDLNWQKLGELEVECDSFIARHGPQPMSITAGGASPFVEAQLVVVDAPIPVSRDE
ncbi:MAG: hypothetical protein AAF456_24935, partial [Planctomycetota bacterium]